MCCRAEQCIVQWGLYCSALHVTAAPLFYTLVPRFQASGVFFLSPAWHALFYLLLISKETKSILTALESCQINAPIYNHGPLKKKLCMDHGASFKKCFTLALDCGAVGMRNNLFYNY